jgi:hypothetical protein
MMKVRGASSTNILIVVYPGTGPSSCDNVVRVMPPDVIGLPICADASVAMKPAAAQIAQGAKPAKRRLVSMMRPPFLGFSSVQKPMACFNAQPSAARSFSDKGGH